MIYLAAWAAGLLTVINPCILPVLPVIAASALATRGGMLALISGLVVSFVAAGLGISVLVRGLGFGAETLATAGSWAMILFAIVMIVPAFSRRFERAMAGSAAQAGGVGAGNSAPAMALTGALLGVVWSPCVGPVLGGAVALSWQQENLIHAGAVMLAFALGASTLIVGMSFVIRSGLRPALTGLSRFTRPAMAAALGLFGLGTLTGFWRSAERWALDILPIWLQDLSVAL
jgi:cytochrome c biogenesis protein CcdA